MEWGGRVLCGRLLGVSGFCWLLWFWNQAVVVVLEVGLCFLLSNYGFVCCSYKTIFCSRQFRRSSTNGNEEYKHRKLQFHILLTQITFRICFCLLKVSCRVKIELAHLEDRRATCGVTTGIVRIIHGIWLLFCLDVCFRVYNWRWAIPLNCIWIGVVELDMWLCRVGVKP